MINHHTPWHLLRVIANLHPYKKSTPGIHNRLIHHNKNLEAIKMVFNEGMAKSAVVALHKRMIVNLKEKRAIKLQKDTEEMDMCVTGSKMWIWWACTQHDSTVWNSRKGETRETGRKMSGCQEIGKEDEYVERIVFLRQGTTCVSPMKCRLCWGGCKGIHEAGLKPQGT